MCIMDSLDSAPTGPRWRFGRRARVAAGLALAVLLVAVGSVLGAELAGSGSRQPVRAELASNSAASTRSAWITMLGGTPASVASLGTTAFSGGEAGHARWAHGIARVRQCLASARQLRASGNLGAARATLRSCRRGYLRLRLAMLGAIHGQLTFSGAQGTRTVAFERGVIKSVSTGSIVVAAPDGTTWTWDILTSTAIVHARHRVNATALTAGQHVLVIGPVVSGADDARLIVIHR
jgi:hypothetical protein